MAATGLGALLTATLTTEQMQAYGWRIPLVVGCGIIPILFWLRRSLQETEYFENSTHARSTGEILRILGEHWVILTIGVMLTILNTTMFYFVNTYTPIYGEPAQARSARHFHGRAGGRHGELHSAAHLARISGPRSAGGPDSSRRALVLATSYPAMSWLDAAPSFERLLTVEFWLAILYAMYAGTLVPLMMEIMPAKVRSSGYSIILSFANGIFGRFTPFIATFLIEMTGDHASPGSGFRLRQCSACSPRSQHGA